MLLFMDCDENYFMLKFSITDIDFITVASLLELAMFFTRSVARNPVNI